jgi:hypothetical protein
MGMSLGQYYAKIGSGGTSAASFAANAQTKVVQGMLSGVGAGIPNLQSLARTQYNKDQGSNGAFAQAMMNSGMTPEVMMSILNTAGIKGTTAQNVWEVAAGALTGQESLGTAVSKTAAESRINQMIAANRPKSSFFGLGNTMTMSTHNHQLSLAETNIDKFIGGHGATAQGSQTAAALLAHGMGGMVKIPGVNLSRDPVTGKLIPGSEGYESVGAALGGSSSFAGLMASKGTIDINGKSESISKWVAAHRTSMQPKSNTAKNGTKGSVGNVTVNLSPQAAQLLSLTTSGAAVLGNNTSTMNSAPTQDPVSFYGS